MASAASSLTTALVFFLGFLVLIQTVLTSLVLLQLTRQLQSMDRRLERLNRFAEQSVNFCRRTLDKMETAVQGLGGAEQALLDKLSLVIRWSEEAGAVLGTRVERMRLGLRQAQEGVNGVLSKFSHQTFRVHQAILSPALRLSALLHAGFTALGHLVHRPKGPPERRPDDRQIFI